MRHQSRLSHRHIYNCFTRSLKRRKVQMKMWCANPINRTLMAIGPIPSFCLSSIFFLLPRGMKMILFGRETFSWRLLRRIFWVGRKWAFPDCSLKIFLIAVYQFFPKLNYCIFLIATQDTFSKLQAKQNSFCILGDWDHLSIRPNLGVTLTLSNLAVTKICMLCKMASTFDGDRWWQVMGNRGVNEKNMNYFYLPERREC